MKTIYYEDLSLQGKVNAIENYAVGSFETFIDGAKYILGDKANSFQLWDEVKAMLTDEKALEQYCIDGLYEYDITGKCIGQS